MERERFEYLVARAVESLPDEFQERMENIDVVVEDFPTRAQLKDSRLGKDYTLLGLYEGIPLTERNSFYGLVAPDKITIFQKTIEAEFGTDEAVLKNEVRKVVLHEIAHHFGIDDERLEEIERDRQR